MSDQVRIIWGHFDELAARAQLSRIAVWKKEPLDDRRRIGASTGTVYRRHLRRVAGRGSNFPSWVRFALLSGAPGPTGGSNCLRTARSLSACGKAIPDATSRFRLMGRRKRTAVRRVALELGWLDLAQPLPEDPVIAAQFGRTPHLPSACVWTTDCQKRATASATTSFRE
jgi:hypothetical protein